MLSSFLTLYKECYVVSRSFFCEICNFCMTYETKMNAKNAALVVKERKERCVHL